MATDQTNKRAFITIGVSASGKSTWARSFAKEIDAVVIERDCIRKGILHEKGLATTLDWGKWNFKWENRVTQIQTELVESAAASGRNIILADTNLNPERTQKWKDLLESFGYTVELKEFEISYEEAVRRDAKRPNGVGSTVIAKQMKMWDLYIKPHPKPNTSLPPAIIVDVDLFCSEPMVQTVIQGLSTNHQILAINTSQPQEEVESFFSKSGVDNTVVLTKEGPVPEDQKKQELYSDTIADQYNIVAVFDHHQPSCRMWRSNWLKVFQCDDPHIA